MKKIKDKETNLYKNYKWAFDGLAFGVLMFLIMGICYPLLTNSLSTDQLFINLILWIFAGLLYGLSTYAIQKYNEK